MSVRQEFLSAQVQSFMKRLKALDLGPIAYKLMHPEEGRGWTRTRTVKAIAGYMTFLLLIYLYPNKQFVPTREIDTVWHHHILDTGKYSEDCQMLFGRFVHHFPYLGLRGEADEQNWQVAFTDTQAVFDRYFGVDRDSNSSPATCYIHKDNSSEKAARCEDLRDPKQERPRVDIQADVFKVLPNSLIELG